MFRKVKTGHKQAMKEFSVKQFRQIDDLVMLVRGPLSSNDRKKFNTVLIIDVHARDIIDSFVRDSILDAREFQWESQLRSIHVLHVLPELEPGDPTGPDSDIFDPTRPDEEVLDPVTRPDLQIDL